MHSGWGALAYKGHIATGSALVGIAAGSQQYLTKKFDKQEKKLEGEILKEKDSTDE